MQFYLHTKSQFHTSTRSYDTKLSAILKSDGSRPSVAITQKLQFCQLWKFRWEVTYHSNFPFRQFYRK